MGVTTNKVESEQVVNEVKDNNLNKYVVNVVGLRVINAESDVRYRVEFDKPIEGIAKVGDDYVATTITHIDFPSSRLIASVLSCIPRLVPLHNDLKEKDKNGLGAAQLTIFLRDAKLHLTRTYYAAGEMYINKGEEIAHQYNGFNTDITKIEVSPTVAEKWFDKIDAMLLGL